MQNTWTLLAIVNGSEYWTNSDGFDRRDSDVFRRRVSTDNYIGADGSPVGARWESKRWHYDRYIAKEEQ